MTVLDDVFDSLATMSLLQLLLAFIAFIGYTLAQGSLVSPRARGIAAVATLAAALGFAFQGDTWARSAVLMAFAVAGLGVFAALVWLCGRLLGLSPARAPQVEAIPAPDPVETAPPSATHARPQRTQVPSA